MLDTKNRKNVTYFIGTEVENTIMKGEKTLFVVGVQPAIDIVQRALEHSINHLYFGTSQSFTPQTPAEWQQWDDMISPLLKQGFWVTLDFGVEYATILHEYSWCENDKFIPMISVKLPYIKLYNYNTTVKLDDTTWGDTNPGVWSHHLPSLMGRDKFTSWNEYTQDTVIE